MGFHPEPPIEYKNDLHDRAGELEATVGITRDLNKHWPLGLEFRNHNELPDYRRWENTAFLLGERPSCEQPPSEASSVHPSSLLAEADFQTGSFQTNPARQSSRRQCG